MTHHLSPSARAVRGFTLVELLVTVALMAVLMTIAVPSFQALKRNSELSAATNSFVALLGAARSEAMKRGLNTVVVPTDGSDWSNGWTAFIDRSLPANNAYDAGTDELIAVGGRSLSRLSMTKNNAAAFFKYNGAGYTWTGGGLGHTTVEIARNDVTGPELLAYTRRIKVNATGRVRVCTPRSTIDAQCDATGL